MATTRLIAATLLTSVLALVANLAMFWREIVSAAEFGVGPELDAFIVASLLPVFLSGLLGNALAPALVPALARLRRSGGAGAARGALAAVHLKLGLAALLLCALLWLGAEALLAPLCRNLEAGAGARVLALYRLLVPLCAIQLSSAVWRAGLGLDGRLMLAALTPAFAPLLGVAMLSSPLRAHGVEVLAWSALFGAALEWAVLTVAARDTHAWVGAGGALPEGVVRAYSMLLAAAACTTSAWLVDNAMAASLAGGSVAALAFGGKVVTFGVGIAGIGISQAVMPVAVELAAHQQWMALRRLVWRYGTVLAIGGLLATCAILATSDLLTTLLFERGAFDATATRLVSAVQSALAVQMPFHVLGVLCVRMLSVLGLNRDVLLIAAAGTVLNVALNLALMPHWGVVGIAAATSAMFAATCLAAGARLLGRLRRLSSTDSARVST